jgi:hypothetical protein
MGVHLLEISRIVKSPSIVRSCRKEVGVFGPLQGRYWNYQADIALEGTLYLEILHPEFDVYGAKKSRIPLTRRVVRIRIACF